MKMIIITILLTFVFLLSLNTIKSENEIIIADASYVSENVTFYLTTQPSQPETKTSNVANLGFIYLLADDTPPSVKIINPEEYSIEIGETISLQFSIIDDGDLDTCYYYINFANNTNIQSNTTINNCANTTFTLNEYSIYYIYLYANDSENNINSSSVTFAYQLNLPDTIGISGSPSGTICNDNEFLYKDKCYDTLFIKEILDWVKDWNQSILDFWTKQGGVLSYEIFSKEDTINAGDTLTLTNKIINDDDVFPVELYCTNFIDVNRDGVLDEKTENYKKFNVEVEPSKTVNHLIRLKTNNDLQPKDYMIGGYCEYINKDIPPATAFTIITVVGKEKTGFFAFPTKKVILISSIIGLVIILIFVVFMTKSFPHLLLYAKKKE